MKHLIIGIGSIGKRHAQILLDNGYEVVGVDIESYENFDFPVYDNITRGWESQPDMVWICTPTHLHAQQAVEALNRGLHVFIEKPVAESIESANIIKDAYNSMSDKRLVWVGCNMRSHPGVVQIKQAIEDGLIGKPLIIRIHYSHYLPNMRPNTDYLKTYTSNAGQGGGVILDNIHDIDLALWFSGPAEKVSGTSSNSNTLGLTVEDMAHISIIHRNGCFSELHMDFLRRNKSRGIEVIGTEGTLKWHSSGKNPETAMLKLFRGNEDDVKVLWQEEIDDFNGMFNKQLQDIMESINRPVKFSVSLDQSMEALKIALKIRNRNN